MLSIMGLCALSQSVAGQDGSTGAFGFGSVHVNFDSPPGFSYGFRDYLNFLAESSSGTQGGPVHYVGNYGLTPEEPTDDDEIGFAFFRLADDINGNLIPASGIIVNPDGTLTQFTDFGDLHQFNVAFSQVGLYQRGGHRSLEVGNVYWFEFEEREQDDDERADNRRAATRVTDALRGRYTWAPGSEDISTAQPVSWDIYRYSVLPQFSRYSLGREKGIGLAYGFRQVGLWDQFGFLGLGGILGRTSVDTLASNRIAGPQTGVVGVYTRGRWTLYAHALALLGYNDGFVQQSGGVGEEPIPGALNRPLFAQPTYFSHYDTRHEFSQSGELWVEVGYQIAKHTTFKVAWRGIALENILMSQDRTTYDLPSFGLAEPGPQRFDYQNLFCGIEIVR